MVFGLAAMLLVNPFISPTTASAATIEEFGYSNDGTSLYVKYYEYSAYDILAGTSKPLMNMKNNGRFNVSAGSKIYFFFNNMQEASFKYEIINANTGAVVESAYVDATSFYVTTTNPVSQTGQYVILLTPTSSAGLFITEYYVDFNYAW